MPGDTFDVTTSKVVRMQTLLTPVMDNIYLDTYFFFVPNRLVWNHWRELMGENTESAWIPQTEYSVPMIKLKDHTFQDDGKVQVGDILDYMGIPVGVSAPVSATKNVPEISALPYRCYQLIYNEWFRDENLVDPVNIQKGDTSYDLAELKNDINDPLPPYKAAKYHDYFTSALPGMQKVGSPVAAPVTDRNIGYLLQTYALNQDHGLNWPGTGSTTAPLVGYMNVGGDPAVGAYGRLSSPTQGFVPETGNNNDVVFRTSNTPEAAAALTTGFSPSNLYTWANPGTWNLAIDVSDLRYAFQLQKLYERDARGGTRYIELIRSHFNVMSPDARMQRPEYLGGNRIPISIHQITNQSQGESDFLGDLGAMSLTTDKHSDFVKSFTEHGWLIGICVARYDHSYPQGLNRMWSRKTRFDFYWPVLANLSEQAILKKEICLSASDSDDKAFGYQERWAEYRYAPNRTAGEMRPGVANTLDSWHFADYYETVPSLSASWIAEDKTNVDRTLAVTSQVSNQLFADIYVKNYTTRPMPMYSIPGLVDHH